MDVYRSGEDSLAGRHFSYRLHPFSVAELKEKREVDFLTVIDKNISCAGCAEFIQRNCKKANSNSKSRKFFSESRVKKGP